MKDKSTKNKKIKYDWSALKLEFFESEYDEVKSFFSDKYDTYSSSIRRATVGWAKDKVAHKQRIMEKAMTASANKEAKALDTPLSELRKLKKNMVATIMIKMNQAGPEGKIAVKDLKDLYSMVKIELGEPTTINQNYNLDKISDELSPEDEALLNEIFPEDEE